MLSRVGRKLFASIVLAAALAAGLWFAQRGTQPVPELPMSAPQAPAPAARPVDEALSAPAPAREELKSSENLERKAASRPAVQPPSASAARLQLTLRIVGPERERLKPERVRVRIVDAAGANVEQTAAGVDSLVVPGLAPGGCSVRAEATGFLHRAQTFDLRPPSNPDETLAEDLVLWPEGRVAIVVRTDDGRPFSALAADLGMEPKRLFVDAFHVAAFLDATAAEDPQQKSDERAHVEFRPPPQYQQWELTEGVVGSLVVLVPAVYWLRLEFHGQPVGVEKLEFDAREVVFRLSSSAMERCFAHLRLRVLESHGDTPVAGAQATLRADTSAHRRKDQERVPTADDGSVEFARIVPGRYELTVQRGEALYQDRIDLTAGEQRDLGIVRLPDGAPLRIKVVDERGEPQQAWIEIGPFEAGKNVHDLYPPMLHEMTDSKGQGKLLMPAKPSIVRAQQITPGGLDPSGHNSANVRIDPAFPPNGEVQLVILDEARVRLLCKLPEARTLRLFDESGLIVLDESTDSKRWKEGRRELEFGRGRYDLRLLGATGELLYERAIELHAGEQELEIP